MRWIVLGAAMLGAGGLTGHADMGDGDLQTIARYGQPASVQATPGALTSTKTFARDGIVIVCGFVDGKVEAMRYERATLAFNGSEIEAIIRSNSQNRNWVPSANGTVYTRIDGAKAEVKGGSLTIASPKWLEAVAKDEKAAQEKKDVAAAPITPETAATNAAPAKPATSNP